MIKDFSVLYAGHVLEGDGIGFDGVPANDRWYDNDRLSMALDIAREAAMFLDDLGFDILWMAEHHFQREGYECIPNLLIMSQYLAQHTQRIKFGCGFNILPMWHPIRLAEDFAMVDILTEGRVVFGIGRGYHTREVESFGAPMIDGDANRELFEEQFEIMMKAFNSDAFSHQGKHYTIPPDREHGMIVPGLFLPGHEYAHIVGGDAELAQHEILRHRVVFAIAAAIQKFEQRGPMILEFGATAWCNRCRRPAAVAAIPAPVDPAIDQAQLPVTVERGRLAQYETERFELAAAILLPRKTVLDEHALGGVSFECCRPAGQGACVGKNVVGRLEVVTGFGARREQDEHGAQQAAP